MYGVRSERMGKSAIGSAAMRATGHTCVMLIKLASIFLPHGTTRRVAHVAQSDELDRTGILLADAERLPVVWEDSDVIFPMYEGSIAHSLWRAQEFSLFRRSRHSIVRPLLDLGCGDGSFAAVLFQHVEVGVDIDPDALDIARRFKIYGSLVQSPSEKIAVESCTVGTVISNSVLEHVSNLPPILGEVNRILKAHGIFIFTVPVLQFARDLEKFFGRAESDKINADFVHRNLHEVTDWERMLANSGFTVRTIHQYQPDWFTYYYWMLRFLGRRGLGRVFPSIRQRLWVAMGKNLVSMVRRSINEGGQIGGNIFVIAEKSGEPSLAQQKK